MSNSLYPIFLKTSALHILVVGGGYVALEKLTFLYKSSPASRVTLLSPLLRPQTAAFISDKNILYIKDHYHSDYLTGHHVVIATTDQSKVNQMICRDCRKKSILINVADSPEFCDFYMGGIVTKGNVKIGISTNGKSPTLAKRIRQLLEYILPDQMDPLLEKLYQYRNSLKADFEIKVKIMNTLTESLLKKP